MNGARSWILVWIFTRPVGNDRAKACRWNATGCLIVIVPALCQCVSSTLTPAAFACAPRNGPDDDRVGVLRPWMAEVHQNAVLAGRHPCMAGQ